MGDQRSDITIFGATGLVGRLTAAYLHSIGYESVTVAGRDRAKLEALRAEFNPAWKVAVAQADDAAQIAELVAATRVLITVVGPYTQLGHHVVDACAAAGVDYLDLCGEVPFIRRSIDRNHARAQETGARIIHACGFDSVPSDMGMLNVAQAAGVPFTEVTMVVDRLRGGISPGTVESSRRVSQTAHADREVACNLHNPYSLDPDPHAGPRLEGLQKDFEVRRVPEVGWTGPFFMAMFNTRIVRRSNALLGRAWGERLYYKEAWATGEGLPGRLKAYAVGLATQAIFSGIQNARTRPLVEKLLPSPGLEGGYMQISHYATTVDGVRWRGRVTAEGDPGYELTAMMLGQAALTLLESHPGAGGVLTPATGLGVEYLHRLHAAGMRFSARPI